MVSWSREGTPGHTEMVDMQALGLAGSSPGNYAPSQMFYFSETIFIDKMENV